MRKVGLLKRIKRSGWKNLAGVVDSESVAEHSFRCAVLAMYLADLKNLDVEKLVSMMLLHDLHEAMIGDYDHRTKREIGEEEIKNRENEAIREILATLPHSLQERYLNLWIEFEKEENTEARMAKQIDKLELAIQALEYQEEGYDREKLAVLWQNLEKEITDNHLKKMLNYLQKERKSEDKTLSL